MCSICVLWTDQFILKVLGTTDVRRWMIIQTVVDKVEHPRRRPPNLCKNDLNRDLFSLELNGFSHHKTKDDSAQTVWHLQSYVMNWRPQFSTEQISGSLTTRNLATKTSYSKPSQTKKKKKTSSCKTATLHITYEKNSGKVASVSAFWNVFSSKINYRMLPSLLWLFFFLARPKQLQNFHTSTDPDGEEAVGKFRVSAEWGSRPQKAGETCQVVNASNWNPAAYLWVGIKSGGGSQSGRGPSSACQSYLLHITRYIAPTMSSMWILSRTESKPQPNNLHRCHSLATYSTHVGVSLTAL